MKNYKLVNFCEFDKYAVKSYCAIHDTNESLNLGDITKVNENELEPFTMIVGGSPCQDFSIAGKQKGSRWVCVNCNHEYNPLTVHWSKRYKCPKCDSENINKTRSSLLVEWLRIIRSNRPNFGIYENVKNIVGKDFKDTTFKLFEQELNEYGYNTYWKVLNAKDYGIPQNRERVYLILIKKELDNGKFQFPMSCTHRINIEDILENQVDERYYISDSKTNIVSYDDKSERFNIKQATVKGYIECKIGGLADLSYPTSKTRRGRVQDDGRVCPTITSTETGVCRIESESRIRKLTQREQFRLMCFSDEDYDKAKLVGVSDNQLGKQAGNSIVVDVLYYILKELYSVMPYLFDDLRLGSFFSGIGAFEKALDKLYIHINNLN